MTYKFWLDYKTRGKQFNLWKWIIELESTLKENKNVNGR